MAFAQISSLDFNDIKEALKQYLRRNSQFTDYDYEGSTLSAIIDLLSYNTYYTAFNTTMAVNESFLSSASLRDNIVAVAKQLGYTPKSVTSASASVQLIVNYASVAAVDPRLVPKFVTLSRGNSFISSNELNRAETYQFALMEDITVPVVNNLAYISNIEGTSDLRITEGIYQTYKFVVDSQIPNQRFILPTENIDTSTIKVKVRESSLSSDLTSYVQSENILDIGPEDRIFFVQEVEDIRYELLFGDGILGKKLVDGQVIEVSYLVSSGSSGNFVKNFVFSGEIYDNEGRRVISNVSLTVVSGSDGGDDLEDPEVVRRNAPNFYSSQNRAVTLSDYKVITQTLYPSVADIIVYGGEDESPPEYGRVKIAIKPKFSTVLSNSTKKDIITKLKKYTVASVTPVIVDPSIVDVILDSEIYWNSNLTNFTREQVKRSVIENLTKYRDTNNISKFGGTIKKSKLTTVIDASEGSVVSNTTKVRIRKRFSPILNASAQYLLCYVNEFKIPCTGDTTIQSSAFRTSEYSDFDCYLQNDETGKIYLYTIDSTTSNKTILNSDVGTVDFTKGDVSLNPIQIISGSNQDNEIFITAIPKSEDIRAIREVYLNFAVEDSNFQLFVETN
jgi:hypothetical protein